MADFEYDLPDFALRINLPQLAERVGSVGQKIIQKRIIAGKFADGSQAPQPKSYDTPPLNHTGKTVRDIQAKPTKSGASVSIGPRTKRSRKVVAVMASKNDGRSMVGLENDRPRIEQEINDELERQIASGEFDILGGSST